MYQIRWTTWTRNDIKLMSIDLIILVLIAAYNLHKYKLAYNSTIIHNYKPTIST